MQIAFKPQYNSTSVKPMIPSKLAYRKLTHVYKHWQCVIGQ